MNLLNSFVAQEGRRRQRFGALQIRGVIREMEGRNPLPPPIRENRGIGYPAAPKDWRPPVVGDLKGSLPTIVDGHPVQMNLNLPNRGREDTAFLGRAKRLAEPKAAAHGSAGTLRPTYCLGNKKDIIEF